jgi:small subunit ribosomal protein S6
LAKKKETTPTVEETVASDDATTTETETETQAVTETATEDTQPEIEATDQTEDSQESASDDTQSAEAPTEAAPSEDTQPELNESLAPAEEAPAERIEVAGGRNYETMFIVRSGEDNNAVTARIRSVVEQDGGAIDNVRISEMRRLAYPIKKQVEGIYVVFNGRFTKETAEELDRALKLDEAVLRHMTLREDD